MIIRESSNELDITGSPAELGQLAARIESLRQGETCEAEADALADPRPYQRCLAGFSLRVTDGPVNVQIDGDRVVVWAGAEMLSAFASFFRFPEDARRGMHGHHEWCEGNAYVSRDSRPLVISVV